MKNVTYIRLNPCCYECKHLPTSDLRLRLKVTIENAVLQWQTVRLSCPRAVRGSTSLTRASVVSVKQSVMSFQMYSHRQQRS